MKFKKSFAVVSFISFFSPINANANLVATAGTIYDAFQLSVFLEEYRTGPKIINGLTGSFACSNWTFEANGGSGTCNGSSIVLKGANEGIPALTTWTSPRIPIEAEISFNWSYETEEGIYDPIEELGPEFDPFFAGTRKLSYDEGFAKQSGSTTISVNNFSQNTINFSIASEDGIEGAATAVITDFSVDYAVPKLKGELYNSLGYAALALLSPATTLLQFVGPTSSPNPVPCSADCYTDIFAKNAIPADKTIQLETQNKFLELEKTFLTGCLSQGNSLATCNANSLSAIPFQYVNEDPGILLKENSPAWYSFYLPTEDIVDGKVFIPFLPFNAGDGDVLTLWSGDKPLWGTWDYDLDDNELYFAELDTSLIDNTTDLLHFILISTGESQASFWIPSLDKTGLYGYENVATVPIPAALPLMASALGMFGVARRRKAKQA